MEKEDSQLEKGKVGITIICPIVALLLYVVLEDGGRFRVVAVEAIEDVLNMFGAIGAVVEGRVHDDGGEKGAWDV